MRKVHRKRRSEQFGLVDLPPFIVIRGPDDKPETPESDRTVDDGYHEGFEEPAEPTSFEIKKNVRHVGCLCGCNCSQQTNKSAGDVYLEDLGAPAGATPFEIKKKVRYVSHLCGWDKLSTRRRSIRVRGRRWRSRAPMMLHL